jgi:tRNA threonylcarbamoyl adenosine modification protein (Sua5/YciO/YrdC/YwlC family)
MIVPAFGEAPPAAAIAAAADALRASLIIGLPTDTVYGIAARFDDDKATAALFRAKQRPPDLELPVLVASAEQAEAMGDLGPAAVALIERFWPGALTLVVRRRPTVRATLGAETETIGLRCAEHPVVGALSVAVGPLATTSANRHGEPPGVTAAAVERSLGAELALVLDAGRCEGLPSTVVDVTGQAPRLLREGRIAWTAVLDAV